MFLHIAIALLLSGTGMQNVQARSSGILPDFQLIHRVQMDQEGNYFLLWTPREDDVVFEVQVKTKGYVGLGFSPNGGMKGADIIIAWVDDNGQVQFSDRHGVSNSDTPAVDESQDYEMIGGSVNDTHTTLRFSRPWVTCDSDNDYPLSSDTMRVIWSYDSTRPDDPMQAVIDHHDDRGTKSIFLKEPNTDLPTDDYEGLYWDVRAPSVRIPEGLDTLYWCKLYKVPDYPTKHYLTGFKPVIDEGHMANVHHMILYECVLENSEHHMEKWVAEKGAQCYTKNMPLSWSTCGTLLVGWAIGSEGEMLPENVGFPLHEKHGGSTYFMLEIHYDNPKLLTDFVDSSGLRMYVTDETPQYEGAMMSVGHKVNPLMVIPPKMKWPTKGYCDSECTKATLPEDGIRVFASVLHGHLLARGITVQHIRDGVELEPLVQDHNYDFNYQQSRLYKSEKIILPGDELIVTCHYDSTNKNITTFGGFNTEDEMCLVFLSYYPKAKLTECYSMPIIDAVGKALGIEKIDNPLGITLKQGEFDGNNLEEPGKDKRLKAMQENEIPGEIGMKFRTFNALRRIGAAEPENLKGTSFYDFLTRDSTWEDENKINEMDDALNVQYDIMCQVGGRKTAKGIKTLVRAKSFIPYEKKDSTCVK